MNVPRVYDGNGYTRRLNPVSMSNNLNLQPLSMASMTLTAEDEISDADWVQIFTPDGKSGYYRVSSISTDTETGGKEVSLAHGACTLDDTVILETGTRKPDSMKDTITNIVTAILSKQQRWTVGTITCTDTIYIEMGGMSLMTALLTVMESIPDYQMEFVQASADDWHIDIKQRPMAVSCEVRLSRNLSSCQISYSSDSICTRVYADGLTGGKMDSNKINTYGVREQTMTLNDALTAEQKQRIVSAYLNQHDHPAVSIDISALELSQVTGLGIDEFVLGKLCRVIIPWLGIVVNEVIVSKAYSDPLNDPETVTISLANQAPDLSIAVAALTGGGGGSGGGSGAQGQLKRFQTKFEQTDEYFRLLATDTQWDELGNGTINAYSQIVQTASSLQSVVSRSGYTGDAFFSESTQYHEGDIVMYDGDMYEFQEDHKGAWNPAHVTQITGMYSSITQHEDKIESLVTKTGINSLGESETLFSKVTQTATDITSTVSAVGLKKKADGSYELDPNAGAGTLYNYTSQIKQTADSIEEEVTQARGSSSTLSSALSLKADTATLISQINNASGTIAYGKLQVQPGSVLIKAINGGGQASDVTIEADKINLTGYVTATELAAGTLTSIKLSNSGYLESYSGYIHDLDTQTVYIGSDGEASVSVAQAIRYVQVVQSGNGYKLQYKQMLADAWTDAGTFSRATTLTGAWSGGVYTVSASPQGNTNSIGFGTSYGAHDVDCEIVTNGNASKSSIASAVDIPIALRSLNSGQTAPTSRYTKTLTASVVSLLEARTGTTKITANGTYTPGTGKIGFSSVEVDVSGGGTSIGLASVDNQPSEPTGGQWTNLDTILNAATSAPSGYYVMFSVSCGSVTRYLYYRKR